MYYLYKIYINKNLCSPIFLFKHVQPALVFPWAKQDLKRKITDDDDRQSKIRETQKGKEV